MIQEFKKWCELKLKLSSKKHLALFNEREICYVNLGKNIWFEQDWKHENFERPVIVFKKFSSHTFLWIPLTSKEKKWKFYFNFDFKENRNSAILSQIRLFDSRRIERKMGYVSVETFEELKLKLKDLIF